MVILLSSCPIEIGLYCAAYSSTRGFTLWDLAPFILCVDGSIKNKLEILNAGIYSSFLLVQMAEFAQSSKAARKNPK